MSSRDKVLILAPLKPGSGNNTTATRIRDHLASGGVATDLKATHDFSKHQEFEEYVEREGITSALGLHALHAGKWLLHLGQVPYTLVYGGTDLNEFPSSQTHMDTMTQVVHRARFVVSFSSQMAARSQELWPDLDPAKVRVIPQGNQMTVAPRSDFRPEPLTVELSGRLNLPSESVIFTLVAGIRPVKDPMYLLSAFSDWHKTKEGKAFLVIVGPELDPAYTREFESALCGCEGVIYTGVLTTTDTLSLVKHSHALVNSSKSEGMCGALLEAMELCVPVIARGNHGNKSIITHRNNGLLFDSPQEFITCAESLLHESGLYETLCKHGQTYVRKHHNLETERKSYLSLVREMCVKL